ncbi:MAG: hypothetical protein PHC61_05355, partial [Chitinivibrionales bacterium]|nr:hypothetical protein [Chitinivibrionales bacterium]
MTFETQRTYTGKTQAVQLAELQSETWVSTARLVLGGLYLLVSTWFFITSRTIAPTAFSLQCCAVITLFGYSIYFLMLRDRRPL